MMGNNRKRQDKKDKTRLQSTGLMPHSPKPNMRLHGCQGKGSPFSLWCTIADAMHRKFVLATAFGILLSTTPLWAQVQTPPSPWRGAGPTPCVGSDGGV